VNRASEPFHPSDKLAGSSLLSRGKPEKFSPRFRYALQPKQMAALEASLIGLVSGLAAVLIKQGATGISSWRAQQATKSWLWPRRLFCLTTDSRLGCPTIFKWFRTAIALLEGLWNYSRVSLSSFVE
jgi:hypothetical protein